MVELFVKRTRFPVSADRIFSWHAEPGALERLIPPWEHTRFIRRTGTVREIGSRIEILFALDPYGGRGSANTPHARKDARSATHKSRAHSPSGGTHISLSPTAHPLAISKIAWSTPFRWAFLERWLRAASFDVSSIASFATGTNSLPTRSVEIDSLSRHHSNFSYSPTISRWFSQPF